MKLRGVGRSAFRSVIMALIMVLVGSGAVLAQGSSPVITTPTPRPTEAPVVMNARQTLAATPESARRASVAFFPLAAHDQGDRREVRPASFVHVVQPGDTLWSLAMDFGRDLNTMACATTPTGTA